MRNADVVVQNVNPAETRDCLRDGVLNRLALGHIGRHRDGDPFLSLDDICGFGRSLVHEIDARDLRPLPRKRDGGCLPVAPSGPRRSCAEDDRGFALQTIDHGFSPCLRGTNPDLCRRWPG